MYSQIATVRRTETKPVCHCAIGGEERPLTDAPDGCADYFYHCQGVLQGNQGYRVMGWPDGALDDARHELWLSPWCWRPRRAGQR